MELKELTRLLEQRPWSSLLEVDLRRYVARNARDGLAASSIARRLSCWRGFYDWLGEQQLVAANPVRGVRAPKMAKRLPKALPPDMAVQLVDYQPIDTFEALRDKAIIELLYSSGLRLSELVGLDQHYVEARAGDGGYRSSSWTDLQQAEATVLGKGGKRRSVPIGGKALEALQAWLPARRLWLDGLPPARIAGLQASDRHALFIGQRGQRIAPRAVQSIVKRLAQQQGIAANVHPHVMRHSFASHLLQSSGDLRAVQELLGHASISTTQVYTALDFQRLAAVYDAAHPRARRKSGA